MKKVKVIIKFVVVCILVFLFIKFMAYMFTNTKVEKYVLNKKFNIYEKYTKNNNYYIEVGYKKYKFSFISDMNDHKKMHIIKTIKYLDDKDITCIYPVFKDNSASEIICNKNGVYYGYYSVGDNENVKEFVKSLESEGYKSSSWSNSLKYNNYNNMKIYFNNIPENISLVIWNYTGIDIISNKYKTVNLSTKDIYNNKLCSLIDDIYLCPDFSNDFDFSIIKEININNYKIKDYDLVKTISRDSYINGVLDNNIYIMDKDNLIQYKYDTNKHELSEIGNKDMGAVIYKKGKKESVNIYDLRKKEIYFTDNLSLEKLNKKYNIKSIYKYLNRYYFVTADNYVYIVYEDNIKNPIFLFKSDSIIEMKLNKDYLFFIDEDNIYMYNRYNSLKKVVTKNEFLYNNKNIYDIYVK